MQPANVGFQNKISWYNGKNGYAGVSGEERAKKFQHAYFSICALYGCEWQPASPIPNVPLGMNLVVQR